MKALKPIDIIFHIQSLQGDLNPAIFFSIRTPSDGIRPPNDADPRHDGLTVWRPSETMARP